MKVLVTGATGFLGQSSRPCARRIRLHSCARSFGPASAPGRSRTRGIEIFEGELTSADDVAEAAKGCDRIYHLAAAFRNVAHSDEHYWRRQRRRDAERARGRARPRLRAPRALLDGRRARPHRATRRPTRRIASSPATSIRNEARSRARGRRSWRARLARLDRSARRDLRRRRHALPAAVPRHPADTASRWSAPGKRGCTWSTSTTSSTASCSRPRIPTPRRDVPHRRRRSSDVERDRSAVADAMGVQRPRLHVPVWPVYAAAVALRSRLRAARRRAAAASAARRLLHAPSRVRHHESAPRDLLRAARHAGRRPAAHRGVVRGIAVARAAQAGGRCRVVARDDLVRLSRRAVPYSRAPSAS